ncbi:MAG: copper homeostasis protein CutC, partial [Propionibacteriaceae bacterium]|nr:copper homeostasis protein CutC [Propionibacteriaceae bacterium]
MSGLLEIVVRHPADAQRAEAGGATRLQVVGSLDFGGLSPEPALVAAIRRVTTLPLRPVVRLREGFSTDGGEAGRLRGLIDSYRAAGAGGVVLGFLNGHTEIDEPVILELLADCDFGWTFSRAVDACISSDRAWRTLRRLPGVDSVLTAGSARGVADGLDDLVQRAAADRFARSVMMAGGGLAPEHVPWLARAGIRAFHLASTARPRGSWKAFVDADLVRTWRSL